MQKILYTNCANALTVTGDYGRWCFCRPFYPSPDGGVSDDYWIEKLNIGVTSVYELGKHHDGDTTIEIINDRIKNIEDYHGRDNKEEALEYYNMLIDRAHESQIVYDIHAHGNAMPYFIDHEDVPHGKVINYYLQVVFDGFEEICRRMSEK
jgi:Zn-finger protein